MGKDSDMCERGLLILESRSDTTTSLSNFLSECIMEKDDNSPGITKSDRIREIIKKHPKWENAKIAEELKKNGVEVTTSLIRKVKSVSKKKTSSNKGKGKRGGHQPRPFPANTLEDAIRIPRVIKEFNGGNAWPPQEVASALSIGKGNPFYYLTASSRDYGLTTGTRDSDYIELTPLGRALVYPPDAESEFQAILEAFFNVQVFKEIFEYYDNGELPDVRYLKNTLESVFNVLPKYHDDFVQVYSANWEFIKSKEKFEKTLVGTNGTTRSHSVIIGEPDSRSSQVAFIIMPFSEKTDQYSEGFYKEVLRSLITPAAVEAGFKVETALREGSDIIQSTIVNELLAADLVIADLSDHNPNVLFELGLRMAFEKPTALIRAKGTKPIFDVDNMLRVYDYNPNLWKTTLEIDIPKLSTHIKATWENRDKAITYMQLLKGKK